MKFKANVFQTKCLSRLSYKVCRLPCSLVLFTIRLIQPRRERLLLSARFPVVNWQFDTGFFDRPITASTQMLVHRWGPEQGLIGAFSQSLVSSVAQATTQGRRKLVLKKIFLLVFRVQHAYVFAAIAIQNKTAFVGNFQPFW